jgi:hypothetical protein
MEDYGSEIEKKMYLIHLEKAFCMEDEDITLWFELNRAGAWLTEFNESNKMSSN